MIANLTELKIHKVLRKKKGTLIIHSLCHDHKNGLLFYTLPLSISYTGCKVNHLLRARYFIVFVTYYPVKILSDNNIQEHIARYISWRKLFIVPQIMRKKKVSMQSMSHVVIKEI
jgi:hypothetical protein